MNTYRTIGAGSTADYETVAGALAAAEQIHAAGWYAGVVDLTTGTVVAEYGTVVDMPGK